MAIAGFEFSDNYDKIGTTKQLIEIACRYGIALKACADPIVENLSYITKAACSDADQIDSLIKKMSVSKTELLKCRRVVPKGRDGCHCIKTVDIGSYDAPFKCAHGCLYCYARRGGGGGGGRRRKNVKNQVTVTVTVSDDIEDL